ncbi:hypothetical protein [Pseudohongiella sp.]|uniref:Response regulatory domain-containing protein n=1 Tax=marine sediment metagenome TaxID=412755 RepID=A0A0F9YK41_9ZZZZ|nr:hypothetical protein [Pseudohongiella sp.]HDZ09665.1 hypothetical protein [Pseudohongiella sp.]HEA61854.1 hypothetical protein [Pseudohongiella sp.]
MRFKPVILIYDIDNRLVDDVAAEIGITGKYTSINTYNEANAMDAVHQYDRGFGWLTNKLACIITGWNSHKKPRDQFLYRLRAIERKSPLRDPSPVIIISEDHRDDLKQRALEPDDGHVAAYLHPDDFKKSLAELLEQIVYRDNAEVLNKQALSSFLAEKDQE